jgi:hypothetical protein
MKVQVSKEWINFYDQVLFIINAVPENNPGNLNTKGKYLNNGSFVIRLAEGGWAYIKYMDQITIVESNTSVSIVDSVTPGCYYLSIESINLLYKPVYFENLESRPPLKIFKEKFITFPKLDDEDLEPRPFFKTLKKEVITPPELDSEYPEFVSLLSNEKLSTLRELDDEDSEPIPSPLSKELVAFLELNDEDLEPILPLKIFREECITFLELTDKDLEPISSFTTLKKEDIVLPELDSGYSESIFSLSVFRESFITFSQLDNQGSIESLGEVEEGLVFSN